MATISREQSGGTASKKPHGRAFYESLGSPKWVLAPMVDQSEFAWRMLSRSFLPPDSSKSLLAYTPMFHARLFNETSKFRTQHFQPLRAPLPSPPDPYHQSQFRPTIKESFLDGHPSLDRPLFVQFCANDPQELLTAARYVAPYCDAVDLNLGCPQGIARRGRYGAFLQEDWALIHSLIHTLHTQLSVPVTAKIRILETRERTLEYARMVLSAGASILTVHGRRREQKGHATGTADWSVIRYLRDHLPPDTVLFANGNILQHTDLDACLHATGADAVMSAEGNLYDPAIFAPPPLPGHEGPEYWRGRDGRGGWRVDAVFRRYLDTVYRYVLEREPPTRPPLFVPSDPAPTVESSQPEHEDAPPAKRLKHDHSAATLNGKRVNVRSLGPSLRAIQPHCFHFLRELVTSRHDIRDALARAKPNGGDGGLDAFEEVLRLVEEVVREGLGRYDREPAEFEEVAIDGEREGKGESTGADDADSSAAAVRRCRRPFWVCQPYVRPLPKEAIERGGLTVGKGEKEREWKRVNGVPERKGEDQSVEPEAWTVEKEVCAVGEVEGPRETIVCG